MPIDKINGVHLYWEATGQGEPLVLVHGSWGDHHNWDSVVNNLSKNFRVITYDRRGHTQSERTNTQGSMEEDVSDLIALLQHLKISSAHITGNSGGAAIVLKTAIRNPDIFKSLVVHEPPLFGILENIPEAKPLLDVISARIAAVADLIEKGEDEKAAKQFVETVAFGPGAWQQLPDSTKQTFIYNAPTFLDECKDPNGLHIDLSKLSNFDKPALLTHGTQSPPFFPLVVNEIAKAIPHAQKLVLEGAGHVPHLSHPNLYTETVKNFCFNTKHVNALKEV